MESGIAVEKMNENHDRQTTRTIPILPQNPLKLAQIPLLMRPRNRPHTLHIPHIRVLGRELDREEVVHVFWL